MLLKELLTLPAFTELHLITPEANLDRNVQSLEILDFEFIDDDLKKINQDDLVITSFCFAKEHPESFSTCIQVLLQCKISAIAIRDTKLNFNAIPIDVQRLILNEHLPIFCFQHNHLEKMVIAFSDIKKSQQYCLYFETRINQLLNYVPTQSEIKACALDINPYFKENIICFYLTSFDDANIQCNNEFYEKFIKFNDYRYKYSTSKGLSYIKYKNGVLIIYTYSINIKINSVELINDILQCAQISNDGIYIGISQTHNTFSGMLNAMHEALDASCIAKFKNKSYCRYECSGLMCQIMTLAHDSYTQQEARRLSYRLKNYDLKFNSNLNQTIKIYLKYHGDISKTAHELHLHPNTIRYRLEKIRELLSNDIIDNDTFYEQLYLLMIIINII